MGSDDRTPIHWPGSSCSRRYKYNFKPSARNEFNAARVYCMNGEGGTWVCAWPQDAQKPAIPITYSEEVFCGMEYAVAAHMIQEGLVEEGFQIVRAVRGRFDGKKRNPWNEFECGSNYARSMASFSLIPSAAGFTCDLGAGEIGFDPKLPGTFRAFFSVDSGWGVFGREGGALTLRVLYGELNLKRFKLATGFAATAVELDGQPMPYTAVPGAAEFPGALHIQAGQRLTIRGEG